MPTNGHRLLAANVCVVVDHNARTARTAQTARCFFGGWFVWFCHVQHTDTAAGSIGPHTQRPFRHHTNPVHRCDIDLMEQRSTGDRPHADRTVDIGTRHHGIAGDCAGMDVAHVTPKWKKSGQSTTMHRCSGSDLFGSMNHSGTAQIARQNHP